MPIYPLVFHIGPLEITGYGIMMMVAFLMGGWLIALELRRRQLAEDYAADLVAAAVVGGIIGAKLWYVALTRDPGALFSRGGLVWYGGFIGGTAAVVLNGWRLACPSGGPCSWSRRPSRLPMLLDESDASSSTMITAARRTCRGRSNSHAGCLHRLPATWSTCLASPYPRYRPRHGPCRSPHSALRNRHHARGLRRSLATPARFTTGGLAVRAVSRSRRGRALRDRDSPGEG